MPVSVNWYDKPENIVIMSYLGDWTFDEAGKALDIFNDLAHQIKGRFDLIADLSQAAYTPPVGFLWEWLQVADTRAARFPNWGLTVVIATSDIIKLYFEEAMAGSEVIRKHTRIAKTVAAAAQMIDADKHSPPASSE